MSPLRLIAKKKTEKDVKEEVKTKEEKKTNEKDFFKNVPTIKELVSPDGIIIEKDHMRVGKKYVRSYVITDYPAAVYIGWLEDIKLLSKLDISVYVYPGEPKEVIDKLTRKITQYQSQFIIDTEKGNMYDLGLLRKAVESLESLREAIQMNRDKLFFVTIVITVYADSMEELETTSKMLLDTLTGKGIRARLALLRQDDAYKTTIPICENPIGDIARNFNVGAGISLFPFASPEYSHKTGIPLGINLFTGSPIIFNPFIGPPVLPNSNMVIFAQAGAGKSFSMKLIALRGSLLGIRTLFIDPEGEYKPIIEKVGGTYVNLDVGGKTIINPFDIEAEDNAVDIRQKVGEIKNLVGMVIEGLTGDKISAVELSIIEDAVREEYRERNINENVESLYEQTVKTENGKFYISQHKKKMPTLSSFVERLKKKPGGERLATIMRPFLYDGTMGIFDGQTNVELQDAPLICFDISSIKDEFLKTYALYVITNWVWENFVKRDIYTKKIVMVDEAWMFMKYKDTANFLENLSRRARKRNASLTLASQSFREFADTNEGRAVLTNAASVILLRQSPTDIDAVQEVFHLSDGEREFLLSCGIGEAILKAGKNSTAMRVVASQYEKEFISTNPNGT